MGGISILLFSSLRKEMNFTSLAKIFLTCYDEEINKGGILMFTKPILVKIRLECLILPNHSLSRFDRYVHGLVSNNNGNNEENEENEEEEEEEEQIINAENFFKSDECVICLTNSPNVLFCNCGHIPICAECDETKSLNICPVCKTNNSIKRII